MLRALPSGVLVFHHYLYRHILQPLEIPQGGKDPFLCSLQILSLTSDYPRVNILKT